MNKTNHKVTCPLCKFRTRNLEKHILSVHPIKVKPKRPKDNKPKKVCQHCKARTRNLEKHFSECPVILKQRADEQSNQLSQTKRKTKNPKNPKKLSLKQAQENPDINSKLLNNIVNVSCYYCGEHIPVVLNETADPDIPFYSQRINKFLVHKECYEKANRSPSEVYPIH